MPKELQAEATPIEDQTSAAAPRPVAESEKAFLNKAAKRHGLKFSYDGADVTVFAGKSVHVFQILDIERMNGLEYFLGRVIFDIALFRNRSYRVIRRMSRDTLNDISFSSVVEKPESFVSGYESSLKELGYDGDDVSYLSHILQSYIEKRGRSQENSGFALTSAASEAKALPQAPASVFQRKPPSHSVIDDVRANPPITWKARKSIYTAANSSSGINPPEFIMLQYGKWLGNGLVRSDIKAYDEPLYHAYNKWIGNKDNQLPPGFVLPDGVGRPPASIPDDINMWVARVHDAEARGSSVCLPPDPKFINRLAKALYREKGRVR